MSKVKYGSMYLNMIRAIIAFAFNALNVAVTNSLLPFKNGMQFIKDTLAQIDVLQADAQKIITGYAAQKRTLRKSVINITYMITKSVFAYAKGTNNEVLQNAMRLLKKDLNKMKTQLLISKVQGAIDQVSAIIDNLGAYNITPEMVAAWQLSLNDYKAILASPRDAIALRKTLNAQIQSLIGQCVHLLSNVLDPLALNIGEQHPQYLANWRNVRRLINQGLQHTKLKIIAVNEVDEPIFNVSVTQDGTTNKGKTNIKGELTLYIIPEGTFTFTITSGTQSINSGPIQIKQGETVARKFVVQQSGFIVPAPISENTNVPA